ncbi:M14 family zinc carboxypeptidase [Prosthecobacter sp.]|uniref:M14 family zinc carboxypeptidase n=1 Tax=Prosthecobacter sp. TaxID=1965333 RepID=UPI0037836525
MKLIFAFLLMPLLCYAEQAQPWVEKIHRITFEEYDATLKYWAEKHPGVFTFEKRGESHEGQPVYLVKITDAKVPDEDKQVALVSALHGGPERSGTTTTLKLIEWLLGDSELAKETRQKQVVLVVPIANPYAFFTTDRFNNKEKIDLYDSQIGYWDLPKLKLAVPKRTPELNAFLGIVDEFQPDVHLDLHGTGLQAFPDDKMGDRTMLKGQTMFEVSACSYSNCGVRPWDPRVTEAMVKAGQDAGYGSDRAEADAQRCFYNPDHDVFRSRLWNAPRPQRFRTMFYGYMKYHTMISTTEIGWEESGVARVSGILALGNKPWVSEKFSGYPVTRVRARAGRFVTAYGETATQRRQSRAELWGRQPTFADGMMYPEYDGRATYVCAVTPKGLAALDNDPGKFVANLRGLPGVNADAIEAFVKKGPEYEFTSDPREATKGEPIQKGIGFRLRIPYKAPTLLDVAVNGHTLKESAADGYQAWFADGYTQVQINLPPEKTKAADLFVVTCAYNGNEKRSYGWEPPAAVMEKLKKP